MFLEKPAPHAPPRPARRFLLGGALLSAVLLLASKALQAAGPSVLGLPSIPSAPTR